jgi:predicted negative regulator of RcsB-dependent stress response
LDILKDMATQTAAPGVSAPIRTDDRTFSDRAVDWINAHRQLSYWIAAILIIAVGLFVWKLANDRRVEERASRELQGARFAFENQNLPLAASELARVVENYSGTNAAEEGRLLLANVRLLQGQPQQAIESLRDYAPGAGRAFRSQAYGLLGGAYENTGRFREAAEAYENGAEAGRLDFQKAQLLSDAGRAWTSASDTARAIAAYKRIIEDFPKEGMVTEAKVRLGELTKGAAS